MSCFACCENVTMPSCVWFESGEKRNIIASIFSGLLVRGETYTGGCMGPRGSRLWLFFGFVVGFASLIASCWILFANNDSAGSKHTWPGVSLFMQNAFIFAGSLLFKFGRTEDLWG
ncbi:Transmembrane protein 50A, partial [Operophtera brumata]